ncbi:hypothetical protein ABW19_dt0208419 [Dactylella cylindrospora]|nr:hypothetical protein ABW19_dt0208419 [Dactylella cylindrospora]
MEDRIRNLLVKDPENCARLETLTLHFSGSQQNFRTEKGDVANRIEDLRLALGRSVETIRGAEVRIGSLATGLGPETSRLQKAGYIPPASFLPWNFLVLKNLSLMVDCFPAFTLLFIKANFATVENLTLTIRGPLRPMSIYEHEDIPTNIREQFPNLCRLNIFSTQRFGGPAAIACYHLVATAARVTLLKDIRYIFSEDYSESKCEMKRFTVNRDEHGEISGLEESEWETPTPEILAETLMRPPRDRIW